jgi:hypothetical protein
MERHKIHLWSQNLLNIPAYQKQKKSIECSLAEAIAVLGSRPDTGSNTWELGNENEGWPLEICRLESGLKTGKADSFWWKEFRICS